MKHSEPAETSKCGFELRDQSGDAEDPDFDALLVKYRDHALNRSDSLTFGMASLPFRKRHIRTVVCQRLRSNSECTSGRRIDELEKLTEAGHNLNISLFNDV